ncbi:cytochrome P450 [Streptomyces sp. NPDC046900]|uniref:cytochrome P450 n=1 Tax=Streptomyces sp. NPDC046900 TaxID=3155473 RepID=UPI0033FCD154
MWHPALQAWLIPGYRECVSLLADPRVRKDRTYDELSPEAAASPLLRMRSLWILMRDGDYHRRVRPIVARALSRSAVAQLNEMVTAECEAITAGLAGGGQFDLMSEVAAPLPFRIVARLLEVPPRFDDSLRLASSVLFRTLEPGVTPQLWQAAEKSTAWLTELFTRHLAAGSFKHGTVIAAIATALRSGELSLEEAVATCTLMFIAGHETTSQFIGNAVLALAHRPDLLADPGWDHEHNAVDELWRYDTSIQSTVRICTESLDVGDVRIPAGDKLIFLLGSANRDERVFAQPDTIDFHRERRPHLGFGFGGHYCLGAGLARLEVASLLRSLRARGTAWKIDHHAVEWSSSLTARGPRRIPMALG